MAAKRRFLDVWIVESNTVYREVPFSVVTDWVQQSRLLPEDRVRPSGTAEWFAVNKMSAFAPYLPKAEPFRAEDKAEALEPVQIDFAWKRPGGDEETDVDMIPLIDISLVLLIFFMMTSAVGGLAALINTPSAQTELLLAKADMLWVGIGKDEKGKTVYSLGQGEQNPTAEDRNLTENQVLERLKGRTIGRHKLADVQVKADESLPSEVVEKMTVALQQMHAASEAAGGVRHIYAGVRQKERK